MKSAWRSFSLGSALLVSLTVVAYLPALRGGFIFDDDFYVTKNLALRSPEGLGRIWSRPGEGLQQYYPLVFTGFWVQYHFWKLQPFGYHLVNVLLHALNAVLLWRVLRRLDLPGAWWTAAFFALHPLAVESVAWIAELKNVLSGMFSLLSLLVFLRFRPLSATRTSAKLDWCSNLLAVLLFVCALLSKTAVCCLPLVIAVLMWWKLDRIDKRDLVALAPWFVASVVLGLITMRVEYVSVVANRTGLPPSIVYRCVLGGRALWFYASKVVWPQRLTFMYPRWEIDAGPSWQYLFPLAALAVLIALWSLRQRIGKGPLAGVLCFATMLLPALGFFNVNFFRYSFVADHFQYLACIGLITLAVNAGATIFRRAAQRGPNIGGLAATVVLLMLGTSTWRQTHIYQDLGTLWRDTVTKNPNAWVARNNWGLILSELGRRDEAVGHWKEALRLKPDYVEAHINLGAALWQAGQAQEAIEHWREALRIDPISPTAFNNLGVALSQTGNIEEAIRCYEQALRIDPDYPEAHYNLGNALEKTGQLQGAIEHYEQTLRLKPDSAEVHFKLGTALGQADRLPEGIKQYEQALRIKPDYAEAHYNLGLALGRLGKAQEAMQHWEEALRFKPDYAEAHYNLAFTLEQAGKIKEAIGHYEQALRIKPDFVKAQDKLTHLRNLQ